VTTMPIAAPPPVVTVPMSADAVPATCGTGCMARVLALGTSPWTTGTTRLNMTVSSQIGGSPSPISVTTRNNPEVASPNHDTRRSRATMPTRRTMRALASDAMASSTPMPPNSTGNNPARS